MGMNNYFCAETSFGNCTRPTFTNDSLMALFASVSMVPSMLATSKEESRENPTPTSEQLHYIHIGILDLYISVLAYFQNLIFTNLVEAIFAAYRWVYLGYVLSLTDQTGHLRI